MASFILTYPFPVLNHALGAALTFWIYAAICVAGFLFIQARLPEAKGKTLEDIEHLWDGQVRRSLDRLGIRRREQVCFYSPRRIS